MHGGEQARLRAAQEPQRVVFEVEVVLVLLTARGARGGEREIDERVVLAEHALGRIKPLVRQSIRPARRVAPLQRGVWNDFVVHVKWSANPSVGFVELYHNGQQVVPPTPMATLYPGQGVYVKQGLYRNASIAPQGVVFHDGFTVATDLADVLPAPAVY